MPRIDALGRAVSGVGDGTVSIDGRAVGFGGIACPRDDHRVVFGGPWDGRWCLLEYNDATGEASRLQDRKVQFIAAGGGHYLASDTWGSGLYGTITVPSQYTALTPPDTDNRGAASPDGTFAVSDHTGQGFALLSPDGDVSQRYFPGVPAYGVTVVARGQALMPIGGELYTVGLPKPLHIGSVGRSRACWCPLNGRVWLVHYLENVGLVLRLLEAPRGRVLESTGIFFCYDARVVDGILHIAYSRTNGERPEDLILQTFDAGSLEDIAQEQLVIEPPPPPPDTRLPQPTSALITSGVVADVLPYIVGDPKLWPRDWSHPMQLQVYPERNALRYIKFGLPQCHETWRWDAEFVYHHEDASGIPQPTYHWTDGRWMRRRWTIGEPLDVSGNHIEYFTNACQHDRSGWMPYHTRIEGLYPKFWCGQDLGERAVIVMVYDPTNGVVAHDRFYEKFYFAAGAGWMMWEEYRSDTHEVHRTYFHRIGGPRVTPLERCIPLPAPIPVEPPVPEPESLLEIVQAVWQKYGGQNRGDMVNEIAWRGNRNRADGPWGLSRKTGGAFVEQPRTGEKIAHDIVHYDPTYGSTNSAFRDGTVGTMFDVFTDSGPTWNEAHPHNDPSRVWILAVQPLDAPTPDPDPVEPPLPVTGAIDKQVAAMIAAAIKPLVTRIAALEAGGSGLPKKVAWRSLAHNKYVAAEPDGNLVANREAIGSWEEFEQIPLKD